MAFVDVHQHLLPPSFQAALRRRSAPPRIEGSTLHVGEGAFPFDPAEHDVEARLAALDRAGVDVAVVSLQPTCGHEGLAPGERSELVSAWEEGIAEIVSATGGRIAALAAGGPVRPGFVGTCVGSDALDALEALAPVLASLRARGGFLFVHPSGGPVPPGSPPWWGALTLYTAQMQAAYLRWLSDGQERWPDVPVVFAILAGGAPFQLERLASRGPQVRSALHRNVHFDSASYGRRALELCIETFGVEQIVYGSDVPIVDPAPTLRAIRGFGESVERLITCDNPTRLLP